MTVDDEPQKRLLNETPISIGRRFRFKQLAGQRSRPSLNRRVMSLDGERPRFTVDRQTQGGKYVDQNGAREHDGQEHRLSGEVPETGIS